MVTSNPFEVNGSFTILDINLIYNVPLFNGTNKQPKFSYCINSKYILLLYFIKVRKINQVFIKIQQFTTHKYIIYDGPGILTTFVRIKQSVTKCSTFQCTIQLLVQNVSNSAYFRFYSIPLPFSDSKRTIQGTNHFVDFPNKKCSNYVCILSVDAEYQQQVNVTIYKINSAGLHDPSCISSGVTTAENIQDDYKQSETLCENHDGTKNTSRSFYSHNPH